ncbi:DUF6327 family protein [Myroides pelagicus]|uniref:DUF6327 family protein n=1 Tax=Myroides pelagicus TaxID=270914 RepID=UPI002DB8E75C|nr:DUF6327 family protein [Myroides pelagicus]MEC4113231.1 DUF6327 family protein [Myroides pelagicus]
MGKTYTSIDQVNSDLEILKVKRELHYQKVFRSVENIKEELSPDRLVRNSVGSVASYVKSSGNIQAFLITYILKRFFKRK